MERLLFDEKAIGSIAIVSVVAGIVVALWLVWGSWVSPKERRAMRNALDLIDEVARYEGNEHADYEQRLQAARAAIHICQNDEITAYDKQLVPLLDLQFDGAQAEHKARLTASTDPLLARKLKIVEGSNHQTEAMLRIHLH